MYTDQIHLRDFYTVCFNIMNVHTFINEQPRNDQIRIEEKYIGFHVSILNTSSMNEWSKDSGSNVISMYNLLICCPRINTIHNNN